MIKNEKQYKITRKSLEGWQKTYQQLLNNRASTVKWIYEAQLQSVKIQIRQLEAQLKEYDSLKSGKNKLPDLSVVDDIPNLLVKWRIRCNLTQRELANLADMPEQQIQRYEETNYQSASLSTVSCISNALKACTHKLLHKTKKAASL